MAKAIAEIVAELIQEGFAPEEALAVAKVLHKKQSKIVRRDSPVDFPVSAQTANPHIRRVDYGEETPEQAKERWMAQEYNDPNGVFSQGGMTAGGVFGGGAVATDTYDAAAMHRAAPVMQAQAMQAQVEMMRVQTQLQIQQMKQMQALQAGLKRNVGAFDSGRGEERRLGKKKE